MTPFKDYRPEEIKRDEYKYTEGWAEEREGIWLAIGLIVMGVIAVALRMAQ